MCIYINIYIHMQYIDIKSISFRHGNNLSFIDVDIDSLLGEIFTNWLKIILGASSCSLN